MGAITCDAALTAIQAVVFNLPRSRGPMDLVVITVAVIAPTFAAALLWSGRAHRREPA